MTDTPVSVLGLGAMGSALARAFLAAGHPTTVWNRTPRPERVPAGATVAVDPTAAISPTAGGPRPLVVLCLLDTPAVTAVLDTVVDTGGDAVAGATVVNLTSATPEDARAVDERVRAAGARNLNGTIMVMPPLVGPESGSVLYSGDPTVLHEHRTTLAALGQVELMGDDPGLAAVYDLGMLDVFFAGMTAFLHAAAMVEADGVPAARFEPYARRMLDLLTVVYPGLATDVDRGEHPGVEDNVVMNLAFLDHIVATSEARKVDASVPETSRRLARAAVAAGHGGDSYSRLVDVLRGTIAS